MLIIFLIFFISFMCWGLFENPNPHLSETYFDLPSYKIKNYLINDKEVWKILATYPNTKIKDFPVPVIFTADAYIPDATWNSKKEALKAVEELKIRDKKKLEKKRKLFEEKQKTKNNFTKEEIKCD